jgi:hypothetical protein
MQPPPRGCNIFVCRSFWFQPARYGAPKEASAFARSSYMSKFKVVAMLLLLIAGAIGTASAGETAAKQAQAKGAKPIVAPLPPTRNLLKESPIVMGRSVSLPRKSKLRHVKAKPFSPIEQTVAQTEASLTLPPQ